MGIFFNRLTHFQVGFSLRDALISEILLATTLFGLAAMVFDSFFYILSLTCFVTLLGGLMFPQANMLIIEGAGMCAMGLIGLSAYMRRDRPSIS